MGMAKGRGWENGRGQKIGGSVSIFKLKKSLTWKMRLIEKTDELFIPTRVFLEWARLLDWAWECSLEWKFIFLNNIS